LLGSLHLSSLQNCMAKVTQLKQGFSNHDARMFERWCDLMDNIVSKQSKIVIQ
jgi:hypothetical protein